jgi:aspartyl-tRNA(Asn)/glutamyl-tRNA(Gln) amidotransferase subunit B
LDHAAEAGGDRATLGKHFLGFWAFHAKERGTTVAGLGVSAERIAALANLVADGKINATAAAQIAEQILTRDADPAALADELGLIQTQDTDAIASWVDAALAENEKAVQDAIQNPKKIKAARGFLTGQVMKASGGKADPKVVGQLIEEKLSEIAGQ